VLSSITAAKVASISRSSVGSDLGIVLCRLLGTCNHVLGVLFRVEGAVRYGLTQPSCTSKNSLRNVLKTFVKPTPVPVEELVWKKDHYSKQYKTLQGLLKFTTDCG